MNGNPARSVLAAAALLAGASEAHATSTLSCEIADATVKLAMVGSVGTLRGSMMFNVQGTLTIKPVPGWPAVTTPLASENLTQQWVDVPDLRLRLQVLGNDAGRKIDLMLKTARVSEDDFRGRYHLTVRHDDKVRTRSGKVTCSFGA
jgi:hypothetical protein